MQFLSEPMKILDTLNYTRKTAHHLCCFHTMSRQCYRSQAHVEYRIETSVHPRPISERNDDDDDEDYTVFMLIFLRKSHRFNTTSRWKMYDTLILIANTTIYLLKKLKNNLKTKTIVLK